MRAYIGLIHKDADTSYGVSFPDLPGHVTAGRTLDEAFDRAHELMALLSRHWREDTGEDMPEPRPLDEIRASLLGDDILEGAVMIAVSVGSDFRKHAAE